MADSSTLAPRGAKGLGIALLVAAAITVAYWVIWFGVDRTLLASAHTDAYYAFENSFPLADAWLALSALVGGVLLVRGNPNAIYWAFLAAGSGIYLGLMDVLFDLENGIYIGKGGGDASAPAIEIGINILTFALSGIGLWWAWRNRRWAAKA